MKKVLFIAIVAVASLASCKKDHTCTCTESSSIPLAVGEKAPAPVVTLYAKSTKKAARANCLSSTHAGTAYVNGVETAEVTTNTCTLK